MQAEPKLPQSRRKNQPGASPAHQPTVAAWNLTRGVILLDKPYPCPTCGCDHWLYINRAGKTLCCWCDEAAQRKAGRL